MRLVEECALAFLLAKRGVDFPVWSGSVTSDTMHADLL